MPQYRFFPKRQIATKTFFSKAGNDRTAVVEAVRLKKILGTPEIMRIVGKKRAEAFSRQTLQPVIEKYKAKQLTEKDIENFNKRAGWVLARWEASILEEAASQAGRVQGFIERMIKRTGQDQKAKTKLENWLFLVKEFRETPKEEMSFDKARTVLGIRNRTLQELKERQIVVPSETRRDRLIRTINDSILSREHLQPEFSFRHGEKDFVGRKTLIGLAVKAALKLGSGKKSKSTVPEYLAEVLTLPQLTGEGIGFIAQADVTGKKFGEKKIEGVASILEKLQGLGINTPWLVTRLLEDKPKSVPEILQKREIFSHDFKKENLEAVRLELGKILNRRQQKLKGLKKQQRFVGWQRERTRKIYGSRLERALLTREDVQHLREISTPEEAIMDMLSGIVREPEGKPFKPKTNKKIIRKPQK
ncbi:MAG: hypothetical protein QXK06_03785 [Candidatus Diapherotrites archaeon]